MYIRHHLFMILEQASILTRSKDEILSSKTVSRLHGNNVFVCVCSARKFANGQFEVRKKRQQCEVRCTNWQRGWYGLDGPNFKS